MTTMKVKPWDNIEGDYVLIEADNFDPDMHEPYEESPASEKDGLISDLEELGVEFDRRWGADKLREALDAATSGEPE